MAALERVQELQQQGIQEQQIIQQLQQEGYAVPDINNAMNQVRIKSAVSDVPQEQQGMQQSVMSAPAAQEAAPAETLPTSQPAEYPAQEQYPAYSETPDAYSNQAYYPEQGGYGVETITEISEQIVNDKIKDVLMKVSELSSSKERVETKLKDLDRRLKAIEGSIENLQQAVMGKVREFGESNAAVHQDLEALHGTMSKMMNPLVDNYNELKKLNSKK